MSTHNIKFHDKIRQFHICCLEQSEEFRSDSKTSSWDTDARAWCPLHYIMLNCRPRVVVQRYNANNIIEIF